MLTQEGFKQHTIELTQTCSKHGANLMQLDKAVHILGESEPRKPAPFCPACVTELRDNQEREEVEKHLGASTYQKTYNVLVRDSTIPKELEAATFENFLAETDEEKRLLTFAEGQAQKYLNGMTGNTVITGGTGIGKSHLSLAIAKAINEGYKAKGEPKSVLFITLTEIIKRIKEGWNYGKGASLTEFEATRLLSEVDYLVIDDLGAKNSEPRAKSDWEQDFLFDILNNRETTIINTNLDGSQLRKVYNERNASRIFKGLEGNSFKAFSIKDKRYSINQLRKGAKL